MARQGAPLNPTQLECDGEAEEFDVKAVYPGEHPQITRQVGNQGQLDERRQYSTSARTSPQQTTTTSPRMSSQQTTTTSPCTSPRQTSHDIAYSLGGAVTCVSPPVLPAQRPCVPQYSSVTSQYSSVTSQTSRLAQTNSRTASNSGQTNLPATTRQRYTAASYPQATSFSVTSHVMSSPSVGLSSVPMRSLTTNVSQAAPLGQSRLVMDCAPISNESPRLRSRGTAETPCTGIRQTGSYHQMTTLIGDEICVCRVDSGIDVTSRLSSANSDVTNRFDSSVTSSLDASGCHSVNWQEYHDDQTRLWCNQQIYTGFHDNQTTARHKQNTCPSVQQTSVSDVELLRNVYITEPESSKCHVFPTSIQTSGVPEGDVTKSDVTASDVTTSDEETGELSDVHQLLCQDEDGDTPLHVAIILLRDDVAFQLIQRLRVQSSWLDIQNDLWQSALHLAVITHRHDVVRHLVNSGANTNVRDLHGDTSLHIACRQNCHQCVLALTHGATRPSDTANLRNYDGDTCCHLAIATHNLTTLTYLLDECGADINAQEWKRGRTLLHTAAECDDVNIATSLITRSKLDLQQTTYDGKTALDIAVSRRHVNMETVLRTAGVELSETDTDTDTEEEDWPEYDDVRSGGEELSL